MQKNVECIEAINLIIGKIRTTEDVSIAIYNLNGQIIQTLHSDFMYAGNYQFTWDATGVASGTYLVSIQAGNFQSSQKVVLLK